MLIAAGIVIFILGAKLVRGAYMEKKKRGRGTGYASPIQPDKDRATGIITSELSFVSTISNQWH
jgi:proline dehydrogenase